MTSWFRANAKSGADLASPASRRDTEAQRGAQLPAGLRRVGPDLPDGVPNELPHAEVAAALRAEPGIWFEAPPSWPTHYSTPIRTGRIAPYRPAGWYEAEVRSHTLYIRYVGKGGDQDGQDHAGRGRAAA